MPQKSGIRSKGLQVKRSTSQKVPKSKGLQVKRSPSQKGYKSKGPQSKGLQKFESMKGIKESCTGKTFIIYSFITRKRFSEKTNSCVYK